MTDNDKSKRLREIRAERKGLVKAVDALRAAGLADTDQGVLVMRKRLDALMAEEATLDPQSVSITDAAVVSNPAYRAAVSSCDKAIIAAITARNKAIGLPTVEGATERLDLQVVGGVWTVNPPTARTHRTDAERAEAAARDMAQRYARAMRRISNQIKAKPKVAYEAKLTLIRAEAEADALNTKDATPTMRADFVRQCVDFAYRCHNSARVTEPTAADTDTDTAKASVSEAA